ncbi:G protein alpha subunit, helical insertion [Cynara cardunculus var. scolymus]|uniref:G protein alpha subunit, helical insertion n=1 Tax=Cynara cardunculus var. scolymus TaxID=59895 RepID=A0A103Y509_CYNCS|nr:G protein alpha subunit, helical insertion [Cynara cardunculus var. scolymus]
MAVEGPSMVIDDGGVPYSFALEYEGPPISHRHLPRAVPINVYKIPVAAFVPQSILSDNIHDYDKLSMPVVQPILASDFTTNFCKLGTTEPIVYPTSLISPVNDENIHNNNEILTTMESQDSVFISSGEFSDVINSSIGSSSVSQDHSYELSGSFENSRNMSANSHVNDCKESLDFSESIASGLSFDYPSSRVSSAKDESFSDQRNPVVTFRDIESEDEDEDFLEDVVQTETQLKEESKVKTRKGVCYRCKKGNRFTEKEVCMVCNAKYCTNCVLRAMGSMPEGRKCVSCIGFSIDESKRGNLGKCSRMLKRLLNSLEVSQIMKAEKLCAVNQLPSEYVCVNGKPLSHEELAEGEKPCQIISPHLNAGGPIMPDASNGNTGVFINGREITKVELRMLQVHISQLLVATGSTKYAKFDYLSGVQCAGNPHFWVNEDGSYQEEGQKKTRGYIWGKAKILYKEIPFTEQERENIKIIIQSNVYGYLGILLEGRERFEDEALNENRKTRSCDGSISTGNSDMNNEKTIYSICPRLKAFSDWLLKTMVAGNMEAVFPVASREYAPVVEELWNHPAAINILSRDYIPSDMDILYADHVTSSNGLSCVDFSFQLIRMPERGFGENCKWLEMFEDVQLVIFCVSLSDYDQYTTDPDGNTVNKMLQSRKLFETIVTHPTYDQIDFLLVLNKFDIFDEKLERVPLTCCDWFNDFRPVVSRTSRNKNISSNNINHIPSIGKMASHYVAVKFKRLFSSLTGRKLFVSVVNSLEPDGVDGTLKYAKEILKWDEEKPNFSFGEYSIYSTEASSYSP